MRDELHTAVVGATSGILADIQPVLGRIFGEGRSGLVTPGDVDDIVRSWMAHMPLDELPPELRRAAVESAELAREATLRELQASGRLVAPVSAVSAPHDATATEGTNGQGSTPGAPRTAARE